MTDYVADRYWEQLLSAQYDETGVGYANLALAVNLAMYRSLRYAVSRVLDGVGATAPGRVLDIGAGTGVWIDYWRERGASEVSGLDLTEAAVDRLRVRFPGVRFERADVGGETLPYDGPFDTISAMSVLLHITDNTRYGRAIENLARALSPGGRLVLIEPLIADRWWGPPFEPDANSRARPLDEVTGVLRSHGLALERVAPATVLLSNPVDTRTRLGWRALSFYWDQLSARVGTDERRGMIVGRVVGALDRALLSVVPLGPTAKVLVARRR